MLDSWKPQQTQHRLGVPETRSLEETWGCCSNTRWTRAAVPSAAHSGSCKLAAEVCARSWSLPPRQALLVPFYRWPSEVKSRLSVAQCHGGRWEPVAKWQEPPFQSCSRVEHCPPRDTVHPESIFSCPCSFRCSCPPPLCSWGDHDAVTSAPLESQPRASLFPCCFCPDELIMGFQPIAG